MNHIKDYMAGAIRQQILELQKILCALEDNSHLDKTQKFDLGESTLRSVEVRLKSLRQELKVHFQDN